jgi:protein-S-isoprenylcysteine O-methyltransferase Ste14
MDDTEIAYKIAVGVVGAVSFGLRLYYQRRLRGVRRVSARHLSRDQVYYWIVFAAFLLAFVYALSPLLDFAHVAIPPSLRWLGLPLGFGAAALLASTHRALGRNWSGCLEISESHTLVVAGPYRRIRHPMYSAFFLMAFAFSLLSANWIVALANIAAVTLMYLARVADEEQMMVDQFGEEYRAYMRSTGRLLPKF